ncbi:DUF2147 domain-containing protein [Erythrobacter sp. W53]|uniref:DUF2147 domain-containing protein n=1 Tax=Erythrobacter sp. W53 TaxID=3425947 RepID=UPI003D7668DD
MRKLTAFIALGAAFAAAPSHAADPITGRWVTPEKDSVITISKCGASYCGKLSKYLVPPEGGVDQRDVNNPNANLRKRKLLGISLLTGFKAEKDRWRGKIYDPRNGKTYKSFLKRKSPGVLEVKGCVGPFCQSQNWTRAR